MKKLLITFFVIIALSQCIISCDKDKPNGEEPEVVDSLLLNTKILLEVASFENLDGNLAIAIYNSSETFNSETEYYRDTLFSISEDVMNVVIDSMEAGTYAISVLHDEDESGDMEMGGFLGLIPQEGFGFSNNPVIGLSEPSFDQCKFDIEQGHSVAVPINLIYM